MTPEFSRTADLRHLPDRAMHLVAEASERAMLAVRFGLEALDRLEAEVTLERDGAAVDARGTLAAEFVQTCAVSGEPLTQSVTEDFVLRFVPGGAEALADEELELAGDELDEIEFDGTQFDLGEAIAQTLALAIDPYATGPEADRARREAGIVEESASGPFAGLAALQNT